MQTGRVLWLTKKRPRNRPVEVIEGLQDEWVPGSGKSQPRPAVQETARGGDSSKSGSNAPQTPSERKVYTPKMADTPTTSSEASDGVEVASDDKMTAEPNATNKTTKPNRRAPSFNPSNNDRVVIINNDDEEDEKPKKSTSKKAPDTKTTPSKKQTASTSTTKVDQPGVEFKPDNQATTTTTTTTTTTPAPATAPITPAPNDTGKSTAHLVAPGQTFYSISKMYDVAVNDILYWNNLPQDAVLKSGQKLMIRPVGNTVEQQPKAEEFTSHTVQQGETMFSISQKYGVKIDQIQEWNAVTDTGVKIGQQLKIKKQ